MPANVAHGILLQILYLIKTGEISAKDLVKVLDEICPIGMELKKKLICYSTFLDIVQEICEKIWEDKEEFCEKLVKHLNSCIEIESCGYFGLPMVAKKALILEQMRADLDLSQKPNNFIASETPQFAIHPMLNRVLISLDFDYSVSMQDDYEISSRELFVFKKNSESRKNHIKEHMVGEKNVKPQ